MCTSHIDMGVPSDEYLKGVVRTWAYIDSILTNEWYIFREVIKGKEPWVSKKANCRKVNYGGS